jgi:hypothetical protein
MKLIGQGVTSCVIQPPYPCDNKDIPKNSIAKILPNKKAVEEENKYKIIHSYDPKRIFSPKSVFRCNIPKDTKDVLRDLARVKCNTFQKKNRSINDLEQLIMTPHGAPLYKTDLSRFYNNVYDCKRYIIREIKRLLYCGSILRKHKMSHMDLHSGNVLVDKKSGKFTVIDFGELTGDRNVFAYIRDRSFTKRDYTQFPPEIVILSALMNSGRQKEIGSAIKNMSPVILRLLVHGQKTGRLSGELIRELRSVKGLVPLVSVMDPSTFPSTARENLYSIRCGSLLSIYTILKKGVSLSFVYALSFVTIDSYAIGNIINTILNKVMVSNQDYYIENKFNTIRDEVHKMTNTNIQERIGSRKVLIDISKRIGT